MALSPAYDYRCSVCGELIEKRYKPLEAPKSIVCSCGGAAHRTFSTGWFKFEGGRPSNEGRDPMKVWV